MLAGKFAWLAYRRNSKKTWFLVIFFFLVIPLTSARDAIENYKINRVTAILFPQEASADVTFTGNLDQRHPEDLQTGNIVVTLRPSGLAIAANRVQRLSASRRGLTVALTPTVALLNTGDQIEVCFRTLHFMDPAGRPLPPSAEMCGTGDILTPRNIQDKLERQYQALARPPVPPRVWAGLVYALSSVTQHFSGADVRQSLSSIGITDEQMALFKSHLKTVFPEIRSDIEQIPENSNLLLGNVIDYLRLAEAGPATKNREWVWAVWQFVKDHEWLFTGVFLSLFATVFLSTRLVSILLQIDIQPMKSVAPLFYLTGFGRFKLYRRYRIHLQNDREARYHSAKYVDLPCKWSNPDPRVGSLRLSDGIMHAICLQDIAVIAGGGCGKSTLCHYVAMNAAKGKIQMNGRRLEPVIVEGLAYNGNLLETIGGALNRGCAYVNSTIVESQLKSENLFVIFDGFSEIRDSVRRNCAGELASLVRNHPGIPFLVTSRSGLPPDVMRSFKNVATLSLEEVDEGNLRNFLRQYVTLEKGMKKVSADEADKLIWRRVDSLIEELHTRLPMLPRIPLMLQMVSTMYNETGEVPKDRTSLFQMYADWLLRPAVTGLDDSEGLAFAVRHLVRESFLKSGGDHGPQKNGAYFCYSRKKRT